MGNLTCANVRESAYDACSESSPKQKEAEYGDRATCVVHTWRVSSFMFPKGVWRCLRTDVDDMRHATSFFFSRYVVCFFPMCGHAILFFCAKSDNV